MTKEKRRASIGIDMKFSTLVSTIVKRLQSKASLHALNQKDKALISQGRDQFKKLLDKGLGVPVVFL
ncbi:MAG: hypothetical protein AAB907_02835 [Patescibacteria group bacterium]